MAPPTMVTRRVVGVSGVLAVALLLFGTRWASYIGYAPLFLTDILLAGAVGYWLLTATTTRNRKNRGRSGFPGWLLVAFLAYVVGRAAFSPYLFTMVWVRDLVPFLYAGVAFLSAATYATAGPAGRAKTMRVLWWALNGHLAWVLIVNFSGVVPETLPHIPGSDVSIFSRRPDMDVAVLAMTLGLYLRRFILLPGKRRGAAVGVLLCLAAVYGFPTRAGLIALTVGVTVAFVATMAAHPRPGKRQNWIVLAPFVVLLVAGTLPMTNMGQRLLATVGVVEATREAQQGALGTANARSNAWDQIIEWTSADPDRTLVGVGFGPDFMTESGAEHDLGTEGVRSPHNWFVGLYARLGIIGVALAGALLMAALAHMWRIRKVIGSDELLTLAATGVAALLVVTTLGVILESPFGAVPFWWFFGILVSERRLGRRSPVGSRSRGRYYNPYRDAPPRPTSIEPERVTV